MTPKNHLKLHYATFGNQATCSINSPRVQILTLHQNHKSMVKTCGVSYTAHTLSHQYVRHSVWASLTG